MTDMSLESVHQATMQKLYAALQHAVHRDNAELILALSSAIQRLNH
jgi:hypothetical protein